MANRTEIIQLLDLALLHNQELRYSTRPANAAHLTLTGAGANAKGAYLGAGAEFVAAAGITTTFWLVGYELDEPSADDVFHVDIATGAVGAETNLLADMPCNSHTAAATVTGMGTPILLPWPVRVAANARITGRVASVGGGNDTIAAAVIVLVSANLII